MCIKNSNFAYDYKKKDVNIVLISEKIVKPLKLLMFIAFVLWWQMKKLTHINKHWNNLMELILDIILVDFNNIIFFLNYIIFLKITKKFIEKINMKVFKNNTFNNLLNHINNFW